MANTRVETNFTRFDDALGMDIEEGVVEISTISPSLGSFGYCKCTPLYRGCFFSKIIYELDIW